MAEIKSTISGENEPLAVVTLNLNHPLDNVLYDCISVLMERQKKYTHGSWDDNFVETARRVRVELGIDDWSPANSARFMRFLKEARQKAASITGEEDFADDSLRDTKVDKINYAILELALEDAHDR